MRLFARATLVVLLLAALAAATGFVMTRNRRMSLFLESRDRIERGDNPQAVLAELAGRIDWEPEEPIFALRVVGDALPEARFSSPPTLHRAGDWALLTGPGGGSRLLERFRDGWRELR
jgi:hypothetical protein